MVSEPSVSSVVARIRSGIALSSKPPGLDADSVTGSGTGVILFMVSVASPDIWVFVNPVSGSGSTVFAWTSIVTDDKLE